MKIYLILLRYFYIIIAQIIIKAVLTIRIVDEIKQYFSKCDNWLWFFTVCTTVYSVLLISSMQRAGEYNFLRTQMLAIIIGYVGAVIISLIDYKIYLKYWWIFALAGIGLAGMVFIFGITVSGTDDTAWIRIGSITVQPSEFMKICFIITFTKHLSFLKEKDKIKTLSGVLSLCIHFGIPMALIHIQGDDGAVLIFGFIALVMMFLAGVPGKYFGIFFGSLAVGLPLVWNFFLNNEHRNRILALFDLEGNALTNYGWQQYQGKVSIASGKMLGSGLYKGTRTGFGIVPEQENDFIFTVAGEEFGFIGCVILLGILFMICLRIIINGRKNQDYKGGYICYGIFALIASQTIINIGMVLGMTPVIGITLPFFSAGGTSVLSMMLCIGLAQSVICHNEDDTERAKIRIGSQSRIKI